MASRANAIPPAPGHDGAIRIIDRIHVVYLGLLPAVATFGILYTYGFPVPFLLFLGGTGAFGVYLAATYSYTPRPRSFIHGMVMLLDGPAWALLSLLSNHLRIQHFAIEALIVDGTAIWVSILILALRSHRPTRNQRIASVAIMLVALAAAGALVWPYCRDVLRGEWVSIVLLVAGIVQSSIVRSKQLELDDPVRDSDSSGIYIAILIMVWIGAMIAGNVLHEVSLEGAKG